MKFTLVSLVAVLFYTGASLAQSWSFTAVADPRFYNTGWDRALQEIKSQTINPSPEFPPPKFIVVAGDIDPIRDRYKEFKNVFSNSSTRPAFLPVIGNHEFEATRCFFYIRDSILPVIPGVQRRDNHANYFYDYRNVRMIVLNQYSKEGNTLSSASASINAAGRAWTDSLIKAAHDSMHIFLSFHEPAFPRNKHFGTSFDEYPAERNAFWNMLVSHSKKVRAVFVGHTHVYSRMRVKNPAGADANNSSKYPDELGGVYQIDVGASQDGDKNWIVNVQVDGRRIRFRTIKPGSTGKVIDEWMIDAGTVSTLQDISTPQSKRTEMRLPVTHELFDLQGRAIRAGNAAPELTTQGNAAIQKAHQIQRKNSVEESAK